MFLFLFDLWHFFAIYPYMLQLKHLGFLSLSKLSLDFPMSISTPLSLYVVPVPIWLSCQISVDLYPYPTEIIVIFHSLSIPGAAIGEYSSIILIMPA